jgi:hypothetical protein
LPESSIKDYDYQKSLDAPRAFSKTFPSLVEYRMLAQASKIHVPSIIIVPFMTRRDIHGKETRSKACCPKSSSREIYLHDLRLCLR